MNFVQALSRVHEMYIDEKWIAQEEGKMLKQTKMGFV